ncbi:hypothetical protein EJ02DRAFT_457788 [Clathrospora elynae]|uniref:Uncharacterized protein n=1 Tax=Clathrospora elynae TaxID=706981 RepID=A0A6A5SD22_9PLEO|nr:hypothetical protein EJ02DRAFT_457788 [Clathrospora elynae]
MTSSAAGSTAFFTLALLTISTLVLLLLRYYLPLRTTPLHVTVPVFLAIALPASIIVLLPIDLASSSASGSASGIWLPETVVYKAWRIVYWLTFVLTWAILPMLGEYCDSGYREPKARLRYALRSNGRYWMILVGCSVVGSVYLVWWNGFHLDSFKSLVMALAYTWGLMLGIYLMGHGLVAFPRSLLGYARVGERLKRIQSRAPRVHEKLHEALEKLGEYEGAVVQLQQRSKNGTAREFQEWIDELADKSSLPEARVGEVGRTKTTTVPAVVTERYLADLTRKLKRARHAKLRFENEWDHILRKATRTQAILDSSASQRLEFSSAISPAPGVLDRLTILTPYTRYHLHTHIIPALTYITYALCILASTAIVWSEVIRSFPSSNLSVIAWTIVHHPHSSITFGSQLTSAIWLSYMLLCAFYSLTEVKIWGNRALVRRNTYQESATWYGLQIAKLTVPLSYNFLGMLNRKVETGSSFFKLLGRLIVLSPLGEGFSTWFPVVVLLPVFATAFGLYGKIRNVCGFGDLLDDDEEDGQAGYTGTGSWREGRALIEREVQGASGNVLGLNRRERSSLNGGRYTDAPAPSSSIATTANANANASADSNAGPSSTRTASRRPVQDDEEDSGNFFENFTARVKNTFETNDFSISRPKWLGGDEEVQVPSGSRRRPLDRGEGERESGFLGLFGGRAEEGRVRL